MTRDEKVVFVMQHTVIYVMRGLTDLVLEQWIKSAITVLSLENIEVLRIMNAILSFLIYLHKTKEPVVLHNLCDYDEHLIMSALRHQEGQVEKLYSK